MGRILGLDLGQSKTGIAVTDPTQTIVTPIATVRSNGLHELIQHIEIYIKEYNPELIVIGIPMSLSGKRGEMARWAQGIKNDLDSHFDLPFTTWDERLSTSTAKIIKDTNRSLPSINEEDAVAAAVILQGYLDHARFQNTPKGNI